MATMIPQGRNQVCINHLIQCVRKECTKKEIRKKYLRYKLLKNISIIKMFPNNSLFLRFRCQSNQSNTKLKINLSTTVLQQ